MYIGNSYIFLIVFLVLELWKLGNQKIYKLIDRSEFVSQGQLM